jgi:hypothetical protein
MGSPVNKITDLCRFLPKKDQFYADAFIIRRDFTSLRDLVSSAIKKVEKNNNKAVPNEELLNINIEKLRECNVEIDNYLVLLGEDLDELAYDDEYYEEIEDGW